MNDERSAFCRDFFLLFYCVNLVSILRLLLKIGEAACESFPFKCVLAQFTMFWRYCTWQVPVTMGNTMIMTRPPCYCIIIIRPASVPSPPQRRAPNDLLGRLRHSLPPRVAPVLLQLPPTVYLVDRPRRSLRQSKTTTFPID